MKFRDATDPDGVKAKVEWREVYEWVVRVVLFGPTDWLGRQITYTMIEKIMKLFVALNEHVSFNITSSKVYIFHPLYHFSPFGKMQRVFSMFD